MLRVKLPYAVSGYPISALIIIKIDDLKAFCTGSWAVPATLPQILLDSQQVTHHADFGRSLHKPALKSQPLQCTTNLPPHNDCRSPFKAPGRAGIKWRGKALIASQFSKM